MVPVYYGPKHSQKCHLWGGVSSRDATPLCIFTDNLTIERYKDILEGHILLTAQVLYSDGYTFQHDNDPNHRTHAKKHGSKRVT